MSFFELVRIICVWIFLAGVAGVVWFILKNKRDETHAQSDDEADAYMRENRKGCLVSLGVVVIAFTIGMFAVGQKEKQTASSGSAGREENGVVSSSGPIPKRFQGAYNSVACGDIFGSVRIGGESISYASGVFVVEGIVAETRDSITVSGTPATTAGPEEARTYTITLAEVGGTAKLDGSEYERCSQY